MPPSSENPRQQPHTLATNTVDKQQAKEKAQEIKRSFRLVMDGETAQSMRDKGAEYKLNWGAAVPMLRTMADEIGQDYDLALELWKADVRECKILATMLMPPEAICSEVVDLWMEQTPTQEIAEQATFNLYRHLPFAAEKAYRWMADSRPLYQLCGFHLLTRLFMDGQEPNARGINEFIDQALAALQGSDLAVRKAAMQTLIRFANLGLVYERLAKSAAKQAGIDIF